MGQMTGTGKTEPKHIQQCNSLPHPEKARPHAVNSPTEEGGRGTGEGRDKTKSYEPGRSSRVKSREGGAKLETRQTTPWGHLMEKELLEMETQVELTRQRALVTLLALETKVELQRQASEVEPGNLKTDAELVGLRTKAKTEAKVQAGPRRSRWDEG